MSGPTEDSDMKRWSPESFLGDPGQEERDEHDLADLETALIIINTPIIRKDVFETIWKRCALKYCADGGANRLLDAFGDGDVYVPDLIKGDLDSLRDDVRQHFEDRGVPVVRDDDQYATDLDKCIKALQDVEQQQSKTYQLVIYGGLSGRLDQTAHTLHKLYKLRKIRPWTWVVSEESLTCVLDAGKHQLYQPRRLLGPTCGILPLGTDSANVTTQGLEWNLDNTETSMDTMVSSSNHLVEEVITVVTDKPVVWTAELRK